MIRQYTSIRRRKISQEKTQFLRSAFAYPLCFLENSDYLKMKGSCFMIVRSLSVHSYLK